MDVTRRNFLKFWGGFTAGTIISPLPWKLLDDVAIWTQNWSLIARPPLGPVSHTHTTCTLCPAGCGLRVRKIGPHPVSAWGVAGHPLGAGAACPLGLGLAQLRYHPLRVRGPVRRDPWHGGDAWCLAGWDEALGDVGRKIAELRAAGTPGRMALLDLRPGRALSIQHREFLDRCGGGQYLTLPGGRDLGAAALTDLIDVPGLAPGYDLARARAVVSFGAPLLAGWCGAGPSPAVARRRRDRTSDPLFLVQIESNASTTASAADHWLPLRPGSERQLALTLAHVVLAEGLGDASAASLLRALDSGPLPGYAAAIARSSPESTGEATWIRPDQVRAAARDLARRGPALAIAGGDPGGGPLEREAEQAVWALNLLLGAVGRPGGVTLRRDCGALFAEPEAAAFTSLRDLPDGSLDLLIVDATGAGAAVPPDLLRRKLSGAGSLLVGLSAYAGGPVGGADLILPVPSAAEWRDDVPPQALAARTSYAWSAALAEAPGWARHPAEILDRLALAGGADPAATPGPRRHASLLTARATALVADGRGTIFDPQTGEGRPAGDLDPRRCAGLLAAGGCWTDAEPGRTPVPIASPAASRPAWPAGTDGPPVATSAAWPLILMLHGAQGLTGPAVVPPVITKLYRESHLLPGSRRAHLNPVTAGKLGLRHLRTAALATPTGSVRVTVVHDQAVMPGAVRLACGPGAAGLGDPEPDGPEILEIAGANRHGVWRAVPANLTEVMT